MRASCLLAVLALTSLLTDRATAAPASEDRGTAAPLSAALQSQMVGVTWKPGCPVPLEDLRALTVPHLDFSGQRSRGLLIVHKDYAEQILDVFSSLLGAGYRVQSLQPAHAFAGDDDAMMAANNTSGFNCRSVGGSSKWSEHAYGRAIDVNPLVNPYVRGERVQPPGGRAYLSRDPSEPGMIVAEGPVVAAFRTAGWKWGGFWQSAKDYQHFSASGR